MGPRVERPTEEVVLACPLRVYGFGKQIFEVPDEKALRELDTGKLWMTTIADRIAKAIPSLRGYPLTAEPGAGPVFFVTLKGAEGDASAARELRERMAPIVREELDKESKNCTYGVMAVNKGGDLLLCCTVTLPPFGEVTMEAQGVTRRTTAGRHAVRGVPD